MLRKFILSALAVPLSTVVVNGQTVVPVGGGSYASYPPPQANAGSLPVTPPAYVDSSTGGMPMPSNRWWTDLINSKYAGNMWALPLTVSADAQGINIYHPVNWVPSGPNPQMVLDGGLKIRGQDFSPADARALRWSDWIVSFRTAESPGKFMDVTLGRGLPSVWMEFTGVQPQIAFPGGTPSFFDDTGAAASFPFTGSSLAVSFANRHWGLFAPDNTRFNFSNGVVNAVFAEGSPAFLVVSALPARSNLAYFARYARAVPGTSRMDWAYSPSAGTVTTRWHLDTEILQGAEPQVIQGWLAHHWRTTSNNLAFNGMNYSTVRGPLRCATGTDFQIVYPFSGLPPMLPPPEPVGRPNDYVPARMHDLLASVAATSHIPPDTYWGGKELMRYAQHFAMASDMGRPEAATLRTTLKSALQNWLTYTPGENTYYFAFYPAWKALVGFQASYGSQNFNDQHFHYGYFTHSAALLGMYDPEFLEGYGPMARQVAKAYANWDRNDSSAALFRTFDVWSGHSQASGFPDPMRGGNQESSSEAVNSWCGLFLLGAAMGDDAMSAAGAMGYAMETAATREYWFNEYGGVWPSVYSRSVVGILWDNGQDFQTYFGLNPSYVHGIQWLPLSPGSVYLAQNPAFAQQHFDSFLAEQQSSTGNNSIASMGAQWGNYALWYILQSNPDYAAAQIDGLFAENDPVATDPMYAGTTYYFTHSYRMLGGIQSQFRLSVPTSAVYYNPHSKRFSYVAWNPRATNQTAVIYSNNVAIGNLVLPPGLTRTNGFNTGATPLSVISTDPAAGEINVPFQLRQVRVTFNQPVSAASLAGADLAGPGVTGMASETGDATPTITFGISGALQPQQTYAVTIPQTAAALDGTNVLDAAFMFTFTTAAAPHVPVTNVVAAEVLPGMRIRWTTVSNAAYTVQCANDLTSWTNLAGPYAGDGTTHSFFDPVTASSKFYRIFLSP